MRPLTLILLLVLSSCVIKAVIAVNPYETYEANNNYPRPLLLRDNNVLATSGAEGGYLLKYDPNGQIILSRRTFINYDSNANLQQLKGEDRYILAYGMNRDIVIILFDDVPNIKVINVGHYSSAFNLNLTPLDNNKILLGWTNGGKCHLRKYEIKNDSLNELKAREWVTDNFYNTCIEIPSNKAIVCSYVSNKCHENYIVIKEDFSSANEHGVSSSSGCGFDKIINLEGNEWSICYLNGEIMKCTIRTQNDLNAILNVDVTEVMNTCTVNAITTDIAYFGNHLIITACVNKSTNYIQLGIVTYSTSSLIARVVQCSGPKAQYPHATKFGNDFISIFYHSDVNNVYEILDYPNCESFSQTIYINKQTNFVLQNYVVKGSGTNPSFSFKIIILEIPSEGTLQFNNNPVLVNNVYELNNEFIYKANDISGTFKVKFAGQSNGKSGKFCDNTIIVKPCHKGCFTCSADDFTNDNNKCENGCITGYYPINEKSNSCSKDPENNYLDNGTYKRCQPQCKFCNSAGSPSVHDCTVCIPTYFPFEDIKNCAQTPSDGYYSSKDDAGEIIFKKCYPTCKTCAIGGSDTSNNCASCKPNETYEFVSLSGKCAATTDEPYYLDSDKKFKPCFSTCSKCNQAGSEATNNCSVCKKDNYPWSNKPGQCSSSRPPYYYQSDDGAGNKIWKPCDNSCDTCNGDNNNNCLTCRTGYYKVSNKDGVCLQTAPEYYYKHTDGTGIITFRPCYTTCQTCSADGNLDSNNCNSCKLNHYPIEAKDKSCSPIKPPGYYLDETDSANKIYRPCFTGCAECFGVGSPTDNNCNGCTNPYKEVSDIPKKCTNTKPPQHFFNTETDKYEPCFSTCETCTVTGIPSNHQCITCLNDFFPKSDKMTDCFKGTVDDYYFENNKYYPCHNTCKSCNGAGSNASNNCIICKDGYYKFSDITGKCSDTPPDNYYLDKTDSNQSNWIHKPCDSSCKVCTGGNANQCTICKDTYHPVEGKAGICVNTPPENHYLGKDVDGKDIYKPCDSTCKTCNGDTGNDCLLCKDGFYKKEVGNICYGTLPPDHYLNSDDPLNPIYKPCWNTCKVCNADGTADSNHCTECKDGQYKVEGKLGACTDVKPPYYFLNPDQKEYQKCFPTCETCSKGGNESINNCDTCKTGMIQSGTNCAANCIGGWKFWEGKCVDTCPPKTAIEPTQCVNCKFSNKYIEVGTTICIDKPSNSFVSDVVYNEITYCDSTCLTCKGPATYCLTCSTDKILHDNQCLSTCPSPLYEHLKKCISPCPNYLFPNDIDRKCTNCKPSFKDINKLTCDATQPDGTLILDPDYNSYDKCFTGCSTCTAISTDSLNQKCLTCIAGYFKKIGEDNCVTDCGDFLVSNSLTKQCQNCADTDQYKYFNKNTCITKPPNSFVSNSTYNIIENCYSKCSTCKAAGIDDNNQNCETCPPGKYLDYKTTNCIDNCDNKYYGDLANGKCVNCKDIGGFKYLDKNECISPKPENSYPLENPNKFNTIGECFTDCATCTAKEDETQHNCLTCVPGKYLQGTTTNCISGCPIELVEDAVTHKCVNCRTDKTPPHYKVEGIATCIPEADLPTNSFKKNETANYYEKCDSGCDSCTSDTTCTNCSPGYFLEIKDPKCTNKCNDELVSDSSSRKCVNCKTSNDHNYKYLLDNECIDKPPKTYIKDDEYNVIENCYPKCETCSKGGVDDKQECDTCGDLNYMEYGKTNCIEDCGNNYVAINHKCINCKDTNQYKYENSNECITDKPSNSYDIDGGSNTIGICFQKCATCSKKEDSSTVHNCLTCSSPFFLEFGSGNCVDSCESKYGENTVTKKCERCADNTDGNIVKYEGSKQCIPRPPNTIIIDSTNGIIKDCFSTCYSCSAIGDSTNNKCDSCNPTHYQIKGTGSCVPSCPNYLYQQETLPKECINCKSLPGPVYKYPTINQCIPRDPNSYDVDSNYNLVEHCYSTCGTCNEGGTVIDNNCLTCSFSAIVHPVISTNCIIQCDPDNEKWYLDKDNIYKCTPSTSIPSDRPILVPGTGQLVESCLPSGTCVECHSNDLYEHQGECVASCPNGFISDMVNHKCHLENDGTCKTNSIQTASSVNLPNLKDSFDTYLNDYRQKYGYFNVDLIKNSEFNIQIYRKDQCHYEASMNNRLIYSNMTECQIILKNENGLNAVEDVIFVKVEVNRTHLSTNQVTTFAYDISGNKLDISKCGRTSNEYPLVFPPGFNKTLAEELAKKGIDVFNPADPFFNDFCYPFYTEDGKDVIMMDRRKDFFQNCSICENGCNYTKIDVKKGTVICDCELKETSVDKINGLIDSMPFLDFTGALNTNNLIVVTCYNLVFNWIYMQRNIGSWIILVFFIMQWPITIRFMFVGFRPIYATLNKIANSFYTANPNPPKRTVLSQRAKTMNTNPEANEEAIPENPDTPTGLIKQKESYKKEELKMLDLKQHSRNQNFMNSKDLKMSDCVLVESSKNLKAKEETDIEVRKEGIDVDNIIPVKVEEKPEEMEPNELDELAYEDAINYDHRGLCSFFWRCLKIKLILLSVFVNISMFEPFCVKVISFFLNLSTYFVLNAILYDETYISQRYDLTSSAGILYILKTEIPKSVYAGLASSALAILLSFLTNIKKRFNLLITKEKDKQQYLIKTNEIIRSLKIKMTIFFILNLILMAGFWYYVSAFCAVYQQTQIPWLEGTLITFIFCLCLQTLFAFLITLFRYGGLKCHLSCLYSLSNLLL